MRIPPNPADITTTWLTSCLREKKAISKAEVSAFKLEALGADKGFFGQLVRVHLSYNLAEANAPQTLFAKFSSATPEMRQRPETKAAYAREVNFYQQLAAQTSLPTPACYYGAVDMISGDHILLLEDLAPAENGSRVPGCSAEQATEAVHQIAHFHARWWESEGLANLAWLPERHFETAALAEAHARWWPSFYEQTQHILPEAIQEIGQGLAQTRADIMNHLFNTAPRTLVHKDYHLDNIFFASPAGGHFAVVDWQSISRGRGLWDVAYFLCQNLEPALRQTVEMQLLADYHQILETHGIIGYSFDDCLYDYRISLRQRLGALISTIAVMPFTPAQRQMHIDLLLPRNIAAIMDHLDLAA